MLDLCVARDEEFGQKTPIYLKDNTTRGYQVSVQQIIFADNSVWNGNGDAWETFPEQKTIHEELDNKGLEEQFQLEHGTIANYIADELFGLWRCSCGAINFDSEKNCHICNEVKETALAFDAAELRGHCAARLEQERKEAEEQRIIEEAAVKKRRKIAIIVLSIIAICAALGYLTVAVIIPAVKYSSATKLLNAGEYEEAMVRFEEIADYKDSAEQIDACEAGIIENKYQTAMTLFDEGNYDEAVASFTELSNYKDSKTMVSESKYQKALGLYKAKDFDAANEVFTTIKSYKDSKNLIHTHDYQSEVTTEPLCDTKGTMTYCCTLDGCTNTYTEDIPALGHDYKEKVIKANTCESDGESSYTCTRCGDTYTETTKAIGHNYAAATCTKPETCKNCGKTKGTALGHTANAVVCSRCGAVSNITADYSVVDGCKITGYTVGKPYTTGSGYMKLTYVDVSVTITRISDNSSSPGGNYVLCCYYETTTYGSSLYWSIESPKELNSGSITVKKSISVGNSKAIKLVLQK